jgi:hypothetical protein
MMMNSKFKSNKLSCIERRLNSFVLVFLALLVTLTVASFGGAIGFDRVYKVSWFLYGREPKFYLVTIRYLIIHFQMWLIFIQSICFILEQQPALLVPRFSTLHELVQHNHSAVHVRHNRLEINSLFLNKTLLN